MQILPAWQFLTIVPLPVRHKAKPEDMGQSLGYFPLVGLTLGLALAGLYWLLRLALPLPLVNALLVVALIVLTGALHLEGFIDTCDGVPYAGSPEDRLRIMSDSRTGSFGVIGGCCLVLLKYVSLAAVPGDLRIVALILMPTISRWAMVYAVFGFPPARKTGIGAAVKQQANWRKMAVATVIALIPSAVLLGLSGLALMVSLWLISLAAASFFKHRLGGLNGDAYGAINEVCEVALLIILPLLVKAIDGVSLLDYIAAG